MSDKKREFRFRCQVCGAEFVSTSSNGKRCSSCAKDFERICYRLRTRYDRAGLSDATELAQSETLEIMRSAIKEGIPFSVAGNKTLRIHKSPPAVGSEPAESHPCPYCGVKTTGEYCPRCVREGLDNVHRVTGRSNGWDRPKPVRPRRPSTRVPSVSVQRELRRKGCS